MNDDSDEEKKYNERELKEIRRRIKENGITNRSFISFCSNSSFDPDEQRERRIVSDPYFAMKKTLQSL
jgi:hypothetical protein